jgi:hypothetical protein
MRGISPLTAKPAVHGNACVYMRWQRGDFMTRLMPSEGCLRIAFGVLIAAVTTFSATYFDDGRARSSSVGATDTALTLESFQEAIQKKNPGKDRTSLYSELFDLIESGRIEIGVGIELDRFIRFLASQLDNPRESELARYKIASFLSKNPHPAAGDALWRAARDSSYLVAKYARMALVSLRDERVLDVLLEDVLDPGHGFCLESFRMIGELGSARAIAPVEAALADSSLEDRIKAAFLDHESYWVQKSDSVRFSKRVREYSRSYRNAARRALRDVRLRVETGMTMPFDLDDHAVAALTRQGFVILPETANELYELLQSEYPYVTVDIVFHALMILARASLDDLESLVLRPKLEAFTSEMIETCHGRLRYLKPGREVDLAQLNIASFAVVDALLKGTDIELKDLPAPVITRAAEELAKIKGHEGVARSSLFEIKEDYSKYKPRGRYESSSDLRSYFQAMLYLGRMNFRIESDSETVRALLLLDALEAQPDLRKAWQQIDDLLALFFGDLDDPGVSEYEQMVLATVPGVTKDLALTVVRDETARSGFRKAVRALPEPRILTMVPDRPAPDMRDQCRGFRVFGQRYSRSIDIFQQWMEKAPTRGLPVFPSGLHVASSLLQSKEAERILREKGYPPTSEVVTIPAPPDDPFKSLREGYLECFSTLFESSWSGPRFETERAWEKRLLNSALGAWTEVIQSTMLYSKDANVYLCASMLLDRFHGYVDPYPEFFRRLRQYTDRLVASLEDSGLFDLIEFEVAELEKQHEKLPKGLDNYKQKVLLREASMRATREMFGDFRNILSVLEEIARKELRGEAQSVSDGFFLKSLHRRFKRLAFNWSNSDHHEQSMALISDPATEYLRRECLQVGIGQPLALYVAVPSGNRTIVCRGSVYSYYEFSRPIEDRLDDATWRIIAGESSSAPEPWIASYRELGFVREATREELQQLLTYRLPDGRNSSGGRIPWASTGIRDPTKALVTARVAPDHLEVLLEMIDSDTIQVDVRRFALRKLKDFGTDPRVLKGYRRQLDEVECSIREDRLFHTRLYYTIQGLGACGANALRDLERAEEILLRTRVWNSPKSKSAERYRLALKESRRMIAAYPEGKSRRGADKGGY